MGKLFDLLGTCRMRLISADMEKLLYRLGETGVGIQSVCYVDELTVELSIRSYDRMRFQSVTEKCGAQTQILQNKGVGAFIATVKLRPILVAGLLLLFFASVYLPSRVLFVRVEGNQHVSTETILDQAEYCGIRFGAKRSAVRSEQMKNALLQGIPQLQWAGINTSGCVAVISVRERTATEEKQNRAAINSIVAKKDGIITDMTVTKGNPICAVGQAVRKGQVLVSAYTDCGRTVKVEAADAEIYAQTFHVLIAGTPLEYTVRTEHLGKSTDLLLLIGKKLIKLSKDSGISDTSCVKMYKEYNIELPGSFRLPLALIVVEYTHFNSICENVSDYDGSPWVKEALSSYLRSNMLAGKIIKSNFTDEWTNEFFWQKGKFVCREIIGHVRNERIVSNNGQGD